MKLKKNSNSFFEFDSDKKDNIQIWTKEEVEFELPNSQLSYLWHSINEVDVDIYINDELKYKDIKVGKEFSSFNCNIYNKENKVNKVRLIVKNIDKSLQPRADRILGLKLRDVAIIDYDTVTDISLLVKNEITNSCSNFHTIESDGDSNFVWTKDYVEFELKNMRLKYIWFTLLEANVDIYINNIIQYENIKVSNIPQEFEIIIQNRENRINRVRLVIKDKKIPSGFPDRRVLGLNLRAVQGETL